MSDRQSQAAARVARQTRIDETCVAPTWTKCVDIPMLELCMANTTAPSPVVLLPELRFPSLLVNLCQCFPHIGKIMIVDDSNLRFELLRHAVAKYNPNLYFSTQEISALNYADDIFHVILTQIGLATRSRLSVVLPSYRRILRKNGSLFISIPAQGSFDAFFDMFEESLFSIDPALCAEIMDEIHQMMQDDDVVQRLNDANFTIKSQETARFDLSFDSAEQLLFSTLVESHYLWFCMALNRPQIDARALLTRIVRSFHHYFQDSAVKIPIVMTTFHALKSE